MSLSSSSLVGDIPSILSENLPWSSVNFLPFLSFHASSRNDLRGPESWTAT